MTILELTPFQQSAITLLAAVLGFASAAGVDVLKDMNARRHLRRALYREVGVCFFYLCDCATRLAKAQDDAG